jgi:hypothetical protein
MPATYGAQGHRRNSTPHSSRESINPWLSIWILVVEIKKLWHGDFEILLTDRARVRLSRRYRGRVLAPKTQDSPKERPEIREDEAS